MARTVRMRGEKLAVVRVVVLPHGRDLPLPTYQTSGAAGMDLVAAVPADKPVRLRRGGRALIETGLVVELPRGTEAQVRPRSGLAAKHGVTVLNSPGTIDCDYRGEVKVILVNLGDKTFVVQRGERIAQMVIAPMTRATLKEISTARATARGAGGFGSTGVAVAAAVAQRVNKAPAKSKRTATKRAGAKKKKTVTFARRQSAIRSLRRR